MTTPTRHPAATPAAKATVTKPAAPVYRTVRETRTRTLEHELQVHQHARLLGGRLVIEPGPGGSERHTLSLPLSDATQAPETNATPYRP